MVEPIETGILSYGMSGEVFHGPLLNVLSQFRIRKIAQRNSTKAKDHFPYVEVVRTVDEVLDDKRIELVIVNTPNETHFDYASRSIEAGKHVIVEKPFTVTLDEGVKLIELARGNKVMLSVFQNRRWDGDFLTVSEIINSGVLGKVVEFEAHYDRFRNYIDQNSWKEVKRPGTGIVYNLGSHMLDQALVLFGAPEYVDARIGIQRPGGEVDDFYDIRLEYKSHLVVVKSSYLVLARMPRYIVHGVEGSFVKFGIDPQEQSLKEKQDPRDTDWGRDVTEDFGTLTTVSGGEKRIETIPGNYLQYYRNIYEVIRENKDLAVKPEDALNNIKLIEACYESNEKKRAIKFVSVSV